MRIRSIKPEFWGSQSVGRLSRSSRLAFIGLWSVADDQGRFRADPRYLAGQLFPYDSDGLEVVNTALTDLVREGSVTLYAVGPDTYGAMNGWADHQKIDRPSKPKLPAPSEGQILGNSTARGLDASSRGLDEGSSEEGKGREGKGEEGRGGEQGEAAPTPKVKKAKVQAELIPAPTPAPAPRPPTRIGKHHEYFQEHRTWRFTAEPPDGLGLPPPPPDEPPKWGISASALAKWVAFLPAEWTEDEHDKAIHHVMRTWMEEPYWAEPTDKETGKPSTPYPWGAFITDKQFKKAFAVAFPELVDEAAA